MTCQCQAVPSRLLQSDDGKWDHFVLAREIRGMGKHRQGAKQGRACCLSGRDRVCRRECQPRPDRRVFVPPASTDRELIMATQEVDDPVGGLGPEIVCRGGDPALPRISAFLRGQAGLIRSVAGIGFRWLLLLPGERSGCSRSNRSIASSVPRV